MGRKITPERKAVEVLADGTNRKDWSNYTFAYSLVTTLSPEEYVPLAAAILDLAAVKWDCGDFTGEDRPYLRRAARMRDAGDQIMLDTI